MTNPENGAISALVAFATTVGYAIGNITVATITTTTPAWGIAGWLGFTTKTVTTITLPASGIILAGGLLIYGGYYFIRLL